MKFFSKVTLFGLAFVFLGCSNSTNINEASLSSNSISGVNLTSSPPAYDGPAMLPQNFVNTVIPAQTGSVINVTAGGDLQTAINNAKCGDTVQLQAGATYMGPFTLPAKPCNDNSWVVIRTSGNTLLPGPNQRINPCYAGVLSLPGRPAYTCPVASRHAMAKITISKITLGAIQIAQGANHYKLLGLEVTRETGFPLDASLIMSGGLPFNNIIVDRNWLHGDPSYDTDKGFDTTGGQSVAIINSYVTDIHCDGQTQCVDSQAVAGGVGTYPMGPILIQNNFLEGAAETILFGGAFATQVPQDISVIGNHMFKPMTWLLGQPGFVGGPKGHPFVVKNLFECKNCRRVLVEGNILENVWAGFTQVGESILISPKSQSTVPYPLTSLTRANNVVTLKSVKSMPYAPHPGEQVTIWGASNPSFNGVFNVLSTIDDFTVTYSQAAANAKSTGGTAMADACPDCLVTDVTIRYNRISHAGNGIIIANVINGEGDACTKDGERYSIHDITMDDLGNPIFNGSGHFLEIASNSECAPLQHIQISHVTAFAQGLSAVVGAYSPKLIHDFVLTNNIINDGDMLSTGGGNTNCAYGSVSPEVILGRCFSSSQFTSNALIGPQLAWPAGNMYPATAAAVHFTNYKGGNGGDYTLLSSSPFKNAGTDGLDLGANIKLLNQAISGAE